LGLIRRRYRVKIIVISDTHIPETSDRLPDALLEEIKKADLLIHLGDITAHSVLEDLRNITKVEAMVGNMDSHNIRQELPKKKILEINGLKIGIVHGEGPPYKIRDYVKEVFADDKVDCVMHGHSHNPYTETEGGIIYMNPGSPTDMVFAPYNSYGVLEVDDRITAKIVRL